MTRMNEAGEYSWEGLSQQQRGAQDEAAGLDIRQYLGIVFKFKWGILSVAFLAGLIGLYSAYKAVPIYQSRATLQIERNGGPTIGNFLQVPMFQFEFYKTQYELIRSWSVAEMAAERLGLLDADHLEGQVKAPESPGFSWRQLIPDFLVTRAPEITPEIRRANIIAGIQGSIRVAPVSS
jgi:uncharacterized protein involved in exopolysaccharide biosynthesis